MQGPIAFTPSVQLCIVTVDCHIYDLHMYLLQAKSGNVQARPQEGLQKSLQRLEELTQNVSWELQ